MNGFRKTLGSRFGGIQMVTVLASQRAAALHRAPHHPAAHTHTASPPHLTWMGQDSRSRSFHIMLQLWGQASLLECLALALGKGTHQVIRVNPTPPGRPFAFKHNASPKSACTDGPGAN